MRLARAGHRCDRAIDELVLALLAPFPFEELLEGHWQPPSLGHHLSPCLRYCSMGRVASIVNETPRRKTQWTRSPKTRAYRLISMRTRSCRRRLRCGRSCAAIMMT